MISIPVLIKREPKNYDVFIGNFLFDKINDFILSNYEGKKVVMLVDENVKKFHAGIENNIKNNFVIEIASGEKSKSGEYKLYIENKILKQGFGRDLLIVSVGGGVTGDLAGFIASTYNRGVPIIHVPTTLLAMVDSSIGGKTGINTGYGKNLIGSIHQPDAVFIDINFLKTLSRDEFINGMAEVIKIAAIMDKDFFCYLEENYTKLNDSGVIIDVIARSINLKKQIVEKDETELGYRQILNFGHTLGHGFEKLSLYKKKHGHCVSIGMNLESYASYLMGILSKEDYTRLSNLILNVGLPLSYNLAYDVAELKNAISLDKKSVDGKPRFIILTEIGLIKADEENYSYAFPEEILMDVLITFQKRKSGKICIPITASTLEGARVEIKEAEKLNMVDLIELRLDYIDGVNEIILKKLLDSVIKKTIVTCRPKFDNGYFTGTETERLSLLKCAIRNSANYIDIEFGSSIMGELIEHKGKTKVILSYHDYSKTDIDEINDNYGKMLSYCPDIIKIVTYANSESDNLKMYEFLKGKKGLIAFCMGQLGQESRIGALTNGSYLTFASLNKMSAPGQLSINEMKKYIMKDGMHA